MEFASVMLVGTLICAWYLLGLAVIGLLQHIRDTIEIVTYRKPVWKGIYIFVAMTFWPCMSYAVDVIDWICLKTEGRR